MSTKESNAKVCHDLAENLSGHKDIRTVPSVTEVRLLTPGI